MGALPQLVSGLTVAAVVGAQIQTQSPHQLTVGSATASGGEVRFVTAVPDPQTITLNVPFTVTPSVGSSLATTLCYRLASQLPSLSLYDYWDPSNAVSRLITGAGVDNFEIDVKGDTHQLFFSGPAADVLDSCSANFGVSTLASFPPEPPLSEFDYSIVPGQLGQFWLGSPLAQVFTLTEATFEIRNNLLARNQEFGSAHPLAVAPGPREIITNISLFAQDDTNTRSLYAAAKNRTPVSAMLQLGQQPGQIMAVYMPNIVPEFPLFRNAELNLSWQFKSNLARGVADDEAYIAFA